MGERNARPATRLRDSRRGTVSMFSCKDLTRRCASASTMRSAPTIWVHIVVVAIALNKGQINDDVICRHPTERTGDITYRHPLRAENFS